MLDAYLNPVRISWREAELAAGDELPAVGLGPYGDGKLGVVSLALDADHELAERAQGGLVLGGVVESHLGVGGSCQGDDGRPGDGLAAAPLPVKTVPLR